MFRESLGRSEEESTGHSVVFSSASSDLFPADSGGHLRAGECFVRGGLEGVTTLEPLPVSTLLIPPPLATILLQCRPKVTWVLDLGRLGFILCRNVTDENDPKNSFILSFCCGALFAFQLLPQHNRTHFCGFSGNASRDGTREKKRGFERKKHLKTSPRSSTGWSAAIRKDFTRAEKRTE